MWSSDPVSAHNGRQLFIYLHFLFNDEHLLHLKTEMVATQIWMKFGNGNYECPVVIHPLLLPGHGFGFVAFLLTIDPSQAMRSTIYIYIYIYIYI